MEWMFPLLSDYTSSFYLRHCFVTIVKLRLVGILSLLREITLVHTDKDWINTMSSLWKLIQKWTKLERKTPMETTSTAKLLWIPIFQLSWNRGLIQFWLQMVGFHCRNQKVEWINHVKKFMNWNPLISRLWYGKWWHIIHHNSWWTNHDIC